MERRAPAVKFGKICACLASGGRDGKSNSHVWVENTKLPSGNFTEMG